MNIEFLKFFLILILLDLTWITYRKDYYRSFYKKVQGSELKIQGVYGLLTYAVISATIWYFIVNKKGTVLEAMLLGGALYAVYDLTNQATLTQWTLEMTLSDIAWGAFVSGASVYLYRKIEA